MVKDNCLCLLTFNGIPHLVLSQAAQLSHLILEIVYVRYGLGIISPRVVILQSSNYT